jgi:Protein of unknown function (DUF3108)
MLFCLAARSFSTPQAGEHEASPFAAGENLVYDLEWNPPWYLFFLPAMDAGEITLQLDRQIEYEKRKALVISFKARSSGSLASLAGMKVDDNFEFITDATSFCTCKVFKQERENKRKRDIEVTYLPETHQLHIREVDYGVTPPQTKRDEYKEDIPECVKDLFSALYWLRQHDLKLGASHEALVGDNDRIRELKAVVEKIETVSTPVQRFEAWRLNITALLGGLFKQGGQLRLWLSADQRRLPVKFEINVSLGKVTGQLKSVTY